MASRTFARKLSLALSLMAMVLVVISWPSMALAEAPIAASHRAISLESGSDNVVPDIVARKLEDPKKPKDKDGLGRF